MSHCEVCNEATTFYLFRCNNHHSCDSCKSKEDLIYDHGGLFCGECADKDIAMKVQEFSGNTKRTEYITCPHCGDEDTDSWEVDIEYDEDMICDQCDGRFIMSRITEVSYSTMEYKGGL